MRKPMTKSIDQLRRDAKALRKAHEAGEARALQRIAAELPRGDGALKHADYLHVIARENSFDSWPALKLAADLHGLDRAARIQRLKIAVFHGQTEVTRRLLDETPDLADGHPGLQIALYDRSGVEAALAADPGLATRDIGPRPGMCHLAFSRHIHARPDLEADMLAIAEMLLAHGASVDAAFAPAFDPDSRLSALYGAIGHADNMVLGRWLLDHGANPNDGESLYHATELGHHEGLRLLLAHGADPRGTNALPRALDFGDHEAVRMLLDAGALDEAEGPGRVSPLHQAARRMSDARMVALLLDAGADPSRRWDGCSVYGFARVFGNAALARALEARGAATDLTAEEALLAMAADGADTAGRFIDPARLPEAYRGILRTLLPLPGKLDQMRRLVALGVEYDRADPADGLTPVQAAGWEGLPEVMGWLLSLRPDLSHVNVYGGTLLTTIIHGSENAPPRADRDHIACLRLALEHGVALPRKAIEFAGDPAVAEFLADWAAARPGQVVEGSS
jgi:hypothetical protein